MDAKGPVSARTFARSISATLAADEGRTKRPTDAGVPPQIQGDFEVRPVATPTGTWRGRQRLPGSLLAPKPPYNSKSGGILLLFQSPQRVGQEVRMVGSVAAPFCPHQEPVRELLFEGKRVFLDRLRRPGEEATAVGEIFVKVKITWGRQVRKNPVYLTPYDQQKYK